MTQAIAARTTIVQRGGATVPEVTDITGPGINLNLVDVTAMDGNGWQEFINTIKNGGQVTMTLNYVPSNTVHRAIRDDCLNGATATWTVDPGGVGTPDIFSFTAFTQTFEPVATVDAQLQANVTLQATGQVTTV